MPSDPDVKTALPTDEEIAEVEATLTGLVTPLPWAAGGNEYIVGGPELEDVAEAPDDACEAIAMVMNAAPRLIATIAHERELREKAEKERDEAYDSVNALWLALGRKEGELMAARQEAYDAATKVRELEYALASSEEARKKAEGKLTVDRLWTPVPHGHSMGSHVGLNEAYQRECNDPACVDWERLEDRR